MGDIIINTGRYKLKFLLFLPDIHTNIRKWKKLSKNPEMRNFTKNFYWMWRCSMKTDWWTNKHGEISSLFSQLLCGGI